MAAILIAILVLTQAKSMYSNFEPATLFYAVNGIDVSHHQGPIDWHALAKDNVVFAYMKATEGDDFIDKRFKENWRKAHEAGIARGAYHFFTRCSAPEAQAANFIATVPKVAGTLPPVIDAEHMGPCKGGATRPNVIEDIQVYLDLVEQVYGKRPIIYTTREFHDAFLRDQLKDEKYWIRSLFLPPRFRKRTWIFWQHHHKGNRNGVEGPVDLNVFRGSKADLKRLISPD